MKAFGVQTPLGNWAWTKDEDGHWALAIFRDEIMADNFARDHNRYLQTPTYVVVPIEIPNPPAWAERRAPAKTLVVKRKPMVFTLKRKRPR